MTRPENDETRENLLTNRVAILAAAKLDGRQSFVNELQVPQDIALAPMTNRPELLRAAPARDRSAEEVRVLHGALPGLLESSAALREHAARVSGLAGNWRQLMKGRQSVGAQIERFVAFDHGGAAEDEEEVL